MLLDSKLICCVVTTLYHNILASDHAHMSLNIRCNNREGEHTWIFDNTILKENLKSIRAVPTCSILCTVAGRRKQTEKKLMDLNESVPELEY